MKGMQSDANAMPVLQILQIVLAILKVTYHLAGTSLCGLKIRLTLLRTGGNQIIPRWSTLKVFQYDQRRRRYLESFFAKQSEGMLQFGT